MSKLTTVHYHLFTNELPYYRAREAVGYHELDREIELTFSDGSVLFFSWTTDPRTYCIGSAATSFFEDRGHKRVEMTNSSFWSPLVGEVTVFAYLDKGHQVLRISTRETELFLSSQYDDGMFMGDSVRVSLKKPKLGA